MQYYVCPPLGVKYLLIQAQIEPSGSWRNFDIVGPINDVAVRQARLVLGWVTVFGGHTTLVKDWYLYQTTQANSASYPQWDGK